MIVSYCYNIRQGRDMSGGDGLAVHAPGNWGLRTMEGIGNQRFGRTRALSEMRRARKYDELKSRGSRYERRVRTHEKKERVKEKRRIGWCLCLYRHGSVFWNVKASGLVEVFQGCTLSLRVRCCTI